MKYFLLIFLLAMALNQSVLGQQQTANTLYLETSSPEATLSDVAWIEGHWRGKAFGGTVEEIWSPPLGDSMMFSFKLVADNKVKFYELGAISEENGTLMLRLKHFGSQLKGWEEKDEAVEFPLVKLTESRAYFDGFTFERISPNEINLYVVTSSGGKEQEVKFNYKRFNRTD